MNTEEKYPKDFQEFLLQFPDERSCWQLPHVHMVDSLVKRWINGTHQGKMSPKYLEYYLDEFAFRFNRKVSTHRGKLFYRLMQQAVTTLPVTYNEMIEQLTLSG